MLSYPTDPEPIYPFSITSEYKTIISTKETGTELATEQWRFPKRSLSLKYDIRESLSGVNTLWNFYKSRRGAYLPFWFFDLYSMDSDGSLPSHTDEYAGRGDGVTTVFDLPGKSSSAQKVYLDGVETVDFTISAGTGDGSADQIDFGATAPTLGVLITTDFTGYLRMRMRFAADKLTKELFEYMAFRFGIELIERKYA